MKDTKSALLQNELSMAAIARAEGNRDLAFSTLYRAVQILSEGTRFERDAAALCQTVNALAVETRPKEEEVVIRRPQVVKWYEDEGCRIAHEKVFSNPAEAQECVDYLRKLEPGEVYRITLKPLPKRSDR